MSSTLGNMPLKVIKVLDLDARRKIYEGQVCVMRHMKSAQHLCNYFASSYLHDDSDGNCQSGAGVVSINSNDSSLSRFARVRSLTATHAETPIEERVAFCQRFERDKTVQQLYCNILSEAGADFSTTCWDRVRLRVQQSGSGLDSVNDALHSSGKYSSTLPIHRDTWASNIQQQINVWMPLVEIDSGRTLAIHPTFFCEPVPNSSASWNFEALKQARKAGLPYPQLPMVDLHRTLNPDSDNRPGLENANEDLHSCEAMEQSIKSDARPVVILPGDVLFFSGAHLHSSVLNFSGKTRFSTEIRIVNAVDFYKGDGAPNVDGEAPCQPTSWFHSIESHKTLHKVVETISDRDN